MLAFTLFACGGDATPEPAPTESDPPAAEVDIEALCAKIAQCPAADETFSLTWCHNRIYSANIKRERTIETSQTSDLLRLAWVDCMIATDGDCEAVAACVRPPRVPENICDREDGFHELCERNVAVSCRADDSRVYTDCRAAGLVCEMSGAFATCVHADGCVEDTCDGDVLATCDRGVSLRYDCRDRSAIDCTPDCKTHVFDTCGVVEGFTTCLATGEACDAESFVDGCDGDAIVACTFGKVGRLECDAVRETFTCRSGNPGLFDCGVEAPECGLGHLDTCTEGVISYCADSKLQEFDCATIGSSGCETHTGPSGSTYPVCTSG